MVNDNEVILCDGVSNDRYIIAIKKAIIYGILSVPYTKDNMGFGSSPEGIKKRILNIAKGKTAEFLFEQYCKSIGYRVSRIKNETPFWKYDKNDFVINGNEVDLKNNFVYGLNTKHIVELPALVPKNQFEKKHFDRVKSFEDYNSNFYYVFSYLPKNNSDFFDINLTDGVLRYIGGLNNNCCGDALNYKPEYFTNEKDWFKDLFNTYGKYDKTVVFNGEFPQMIIGGCASRNDGDMRLFKLVSAGETFKTSGGNIYTKHNTKSNGNYFTSIKELRPFKFSDSIDILDEEYCDYNDCLYLFD